VTRAATFRPVQLSASYSRRRDPPEDDPRGSRGVAATRLRGISASCHPARDREDRLQQRPIAFDERAERAGSARFSRVRRVEEDDCRGPLFSGEGADEALEIFEQCREALDQEMP